MRGFQDSSGHLGHSADTSRESAQSGRTIAVDLPSLLAAGWTLREIEDQLDLIENCRRMRSSSSRQKKCCQH